MHRFRILYIEDNPLDFRLVHELFKENKSFFADLENAVTLKEGLNKIQKESFDLIILDLNLSDSMGVETFDAFRDVINSVPLILLTGVQDEELAVELLKKGAQDYLTKSDINSYNLTRSILYSIERKKLIKTISSELENRKRIEAQLNFQSSILLNVNDAVITTNKNFEVTFWNNVAEIFYGWKKEEVIGKNPDIILNTTQINTNRNLRSTLGNFTNLTKNLILQTKKNGEQICIERNEFVYKDENNKITGYGSINRDVTNKVKVEQELIKQYSILEAIFNNSHHIIIFLLDRNYCYLTFNRNHLEEMKNVYGIDIKIGMNMLDLITNPVVKLKAKESYDRALAGESFVEIQFQPDLNIYYEFHWNSVTREKTDIFGLSCFVINITDRKRAEELLITSESRLRLLIQTIPDLIWLKDTKGVYLSCNTMFERFFGAKEADIIGKTDYDFIDRKLAEDFLENDRKAMELGKPSSNEEWIIFADDGHRAFLETIKTPMYDSESKLLGILGIGRDITERWQSEETLRKSEEKFKSIYEGSNDAIMLLNEKGFFDCNPQALKMFGISSKEEFIKLTPSDLSPPNQTDGKNSFESSNEKIHSAYQQSIDRFDWIHRRSNGEDFPTEVLLSVFNLGSKQLLQATVRDISDRKLFEKELINAKEKAEEMNHLKNCFLSNMSHELRTPLISVLGFAELLQQELKDSEQLEFVKNIMEGGQRLNNTLTEILEISKLEATESFIKMQSCNLADEIKEIVKSFLPMAQSKRLFLKTELSDSNLNAQIDCELFGKALFHLVSNGIKFTNEGGILVTLNHERKHDRDWAVTKVIDTGIGISKENLNVIFNAFKQVSEGDGRNFQGTGLGITIAKRIVELMKGYLEVESEIGKGSVFSIWLPAIPNKKLIHHQIEEKKTATIIKPPTTIEKGLPKVLVVDDNSSNRLFINHILRSHVRIIEAEDGISAVSFASKEHFDLILMDINLGAGIDGVETMHQIKKIPEYSNVPIIAVTAYAMWGDKERFLSVGFANYLEKPFTKANLVDLVERALVKEKNT